MLDFFRCKLDLESHQKREQSFVAFVITTSSVLVHLIRHYRDNVVDSLACDWTLFSPEAIECDKYF